MHRNVCGLSSRALQIAGAQLMSNEMVPSLRFISYQSGNSLFRRWRHLLLAYPSDGEARVGIAVLLVERLRREWSALIGTPVGRMRCHASRTTATVRMGAAELALGSLSGAESRWRLSSGLEVRCSLRERWSLSGPNHPLIDIVKRGDSIEACRMNPSARERVPSQVDLDSPSVNWGSVASSYLLPSHSSALLQGILSAVSGHSTPRLVFRKTCVDALDALQPDECAVLMAIIGAEMTRTMLEVC